VAAELLARGQRVRGLTRDAARGAAWAAGGGDAAVGSLDDPEFLARTLEGAAGFFVLLPEDPFAADFHGGRRAMADAIVSAVREREVPHVVVLSAVAASLADGNGPAKDLHYLERAVRKTSARVTVIRASWFQENVGAVVPAARAAGIYPTSWGRPTLRFQRSQRAMSDAWWRRCCWRHQPTSEVIDLVGPSYSARDLAKALGAALGKPLQVVDVPPPAASVRWSRRVSRNPSRRKWRSCMPASSPGGQAGRRPPDLGGDRHRAGAAGACRYVTVSFRAEAPRPEARNRRTLSSGAEAPEGAKARNRDLPGPRDKAPVGRIAIPRPGLALGAGYRSE
jgi:uncharacterized protein YbjT (DUF2867 family)